jgi:hypothetical protein
MLQTNKIKVDPKQKEHFSSVKCFVLQRSCMTQDLSLVSENLSEPGIILSRFMSYCIIY